MYIYIYIYIYIYTDIGYTLHGATGSAGAYVGLQSPVALLYRCLISRCILQSEGGIIITIIAMCLFVI